MKKSISCCNCFHNQGGIDDIPNRYRCIINQVVIDSSSNRYVCEKHLKMSKKNAPNYRELKERDCCNNCIHFDWDMTGNNMDCFKYDIGFVFGDNVENDMICNSFERKRL